MRSGEHRCAVPRPVRLRAPDSAWPEHNAGSRRRLAPRNRPGVRRRGDRPYRRASERQPHGVHHGRHGRRHRNRGCAGDRAGGPGKTASLRSAWSPSRSTSRARSACGWPKAGFRNCRRVVDTLIVIPNQNLFRVANEENDLRRRLPHGGRSVAFGCTRHNRPDGNARPHQSGFRRCPLGHVGNGQGHDGRGAWPRGEGRSIEAAESAISNPPARRRFDERRARPAD